MDDNALSPKQNETDLAAERGLSELLSIIIKSAILINLGLIVSILLFTPQDFFGLTLTTVANIILLLALMLLRLGRIQLVAWGIVISLWIVVFLGSGIREGVRNPSHGGLLVIILAAGLLLGRKATLITAVVSIIGTVLLVVAEYIGWIPIASTQSDSLATVMIMHILFIFISAALLLLIFEKIQHSLTQTKKTAAALAESETRIRALVEGYFEAIGISVQGKVVEANQALASLLGLENPAQVVGLSIYDIHTPASKEVIQHVVSQGLEVPYQVHLQRVDGTTVAVEAFGRNAVYMGQPARIVALRDLTKQNETEEHLRQAQKLESLGVMAGAIAHDFNNLLLAIMGQNSVAQAKLPPDSAARKHLLKSMEASKRAANLTKQLLAYSGQGHFMMLEVQLNDLIQDNLELFDLVATYSVSLKLQLADQLPPILADSTQIQQILLNLLINAAEAGDGATRHIQLQTAVFALATPSHYYGKLINQVTPAGHYVKLTVQDDGPGIAEEQLSQIFEPFYSTKGTGRGLGLAAIVGIMRGHQGGLAVDSELGVGTVFTLLFPIAAEPALTTVSPIPSVGANERQEPPT